MTMTPMQSTLARAAKELGLRIEVGKVVMLPDGARVEAQVLFPDLGAPRGTLVFDWQTTPDAQIRKAIWEAGFTMSTFGQPRPDEEFDIAGYAAMFSEWCWTGDEAERPSWLKDPPDE